MTQNPSKSPFLKGDFFYPPLDKEGLGVILKRTNELLLTFYEKLLTLNHIYGTLSVMKFDEPLLGKAEKWAKILGKLPGVQAIFLSGSIACGRARKSSDIDILIIARAGQIWTARFFVFLVLKIFGKLAKPHNHAGRICPNHFLTDHSLEINEKDAYSAQLFCNNIPLYDPLNLWTNFVEENKEWIEKFGEHFDEIPDKTFGPPRKRFRGRKSLWERFFRWIQKAKIMRNPDFDRPGAKIILSDTELRFHPVPKNKNWQK